MRTAEDFRVISDTECGRQVYRVMFYGSPFCFGAVDASFTDKKEAMDYCNQKNNEKPAIGEE